MNKSNAPIPASFQSVPFVIMLNPASQTLLIILKCHENIGNNDNQPSATA